MGYQNVRTPRIYVDYGQYFKALGQLTYAGSYLAGGRLIGLNPSNIQTFSSTGDSDWMTSHYNLPWTSPDQMRINYCAWLGHNCATIGANFGVSTLADNQFFDVDFDTENRVNFIANTDAVKFDGFSLVQFSGGENGFETFRPSVFPHGGGGAGTINGDLKMGALSFGRYYDMPHSPDLSLTMSHEYDGVKTIRTKGGSTLSNANYHKPPMWGELDAWQLHHTGSSIRVGEYNPLYHMSGRRSWNLSFSFIADKALEPYNHSGYEWSSDTDVSSDNSLGAELPAQDNFFSDVLRYTMGGHLPFIFCPDPSIVFWDAFDGGWDRPPRVPEFAICRFDMNSFERKQVANNVYNVEFKIEESW